VAPSLAPLQASADAAGALGVAEPDPALPVESAAHAGALARKKAPRAKLASRSVIDLLLEAAVRRRLEASTRGSGIRFSVAGCLHDGGFIARGPVQTRSRRIAGSNPGRPQAGLEVGLNKRRPLMSIRWKSLAIGTALIVGLGTTGDLRAAAFGPGGCRGGHGLWGLEHRIGQLGLPADTLQSVTQAIEQAKTQEKAAREQIRAAHEQMQTLLEQTPPNVDQVLAQADSIGSLETQARKVELQAMLTVRGMLSTQQWQQLQSERWHHGEGQPQSTPDDGTSSSAPSAL
jgi:Spy/CpxP family protein refolding chaperone